MAWVLSWIDLDMLALMPWQRAEDNHVNADDTPEEREEKERKQAKWQYLPSKHVWKLTFARYLQSIPQLIIQLAFIIAMPRESSTLFLMSIVFSAICIIFTGFKKLLISKGQDGSNGKEQTEQDDTIATVEIVDVQQPSTELLTEQDDSNGKEQPPTTTAEVVNVQEPSTEMLNNEA